MYWFGFDGVGAWESAIYALGKTQIRRIPRPEVVSEENLRAQASLLAQATTPALCGNADSRNRPHRGAALRDRGPDRGSVDGVLLPSLSGKRRAAAFQAYLAAIAATSAVTAPAEAYGDLLSDNPRRGEKWSDYLTARVRVAAQDAVLAAAVPDLAGIASRYIARLDATPDPPKCIVHGDIHPANVMMNDDLQVTGLIDFSFTTRVGDHAMNLTGACFYLTAYGLSAKADLDYVRQLILAKYGAEVIDRIGLYGVWFAFDFAYYHDAVEVLKWCTKLIRDFGEV